MKKFLILTFSLFLFPLHASALTLQEEQYLKEHCQDIRNSEDAKRKLSEARNNKNQQEFDRVLNCLNLLTKQTMEMVDKSIRKKTHKTNKE